MDQSDVSSSSKKFCFPIFSLRGHYTRPYRSTRVYMSMNAQSNKNYIPLQPVHHLQRYPMNKQFNIIKAFSIHLLLRQCLFKERRRHPDG